MLNPSTKYIMELNCTHMPKHFNKISHTNSPKFQAPLIDKL